ncbi:MAG: response regulator [Planctomycetes bacterium]|nr:response regulator [Planctomycetota bacterium]
MARVLLVEDDEGQRKELDILLRSGNHQVHMAGNGALAMLVARDKAPEVVLTDIDMPKMDGIELCRRLRADPATKGAWIVLLTALERGDLRDAGREAGADDYVRKPVAADDLLARVEAGGRGFVLRQEAARLREENRRLRATQEALVAALDAGLRGIEGASTRLGAGDPPSALSALRASHEELKELLSGIEIPEGGQAT